MKYRTAPPPPPGGLGLKYPVSLRVPVKSSVPVVVVGLALVETPGDGKTDTFGDGVVGRITMHHVLCHSLFSQLMKFK